ncbi:hypothetical protein P3S68_008703 [Capsicum galapagoense]
MWCITVVFFLIMGTVIWILEQRLNDDFRGPPSKQLVSVLWFNFSTLFTAQRENTVSTLGRIVLLIWLFCVFDNKFKLHCQSHINSYHAETFFTNYRN